jgi:SAM-dependent methyltransferase
MTLTPSQTRHYTSSRHGWRSFITSIANDLKAHRENPESIVNHRLEDARAMEQSLFGHPLRDADVLDIGPGQVPIQLMYFQRDNRAIGIDVNRISYHRTPLVLLQIARESGHIRACKTLGRWVLGYDTRLRRCVAQCLGMSSIRWPRVLQMDAQKMDFSDQSFDFVYSRTVFQHIKDPLSALREVRRVLKPGGAVHISLHLWSCPNGYTYVPAPSWEWPHLRNQALPHEIDQSRNRLRLAEWRELFQGVFPGCDVRLRGPGTPAMLKRAEELRQDGLSQYSVEELINYEVSMVWKS